MDDYANERETEEYKIPKSKNRHAKKSLDALVEDDEEKIKKDALQEASTKANLETRSEGGQDRG
jgi:hypothetical protein